MDDRRSSVVLTAGAALVLAGGAIHTWLAFDQYGTADLEKVFFLNGAGSAVIAAAIVRTRHPLAALFGAGVSGFSLLAFGLSRVGGGVLGFRATGLDPVPEAPLTLLVEAGALVALGLVVVARRERLVHAVRAAISG